jgi:hydrogenase expression/formation protein HypE
MAAAASVAGVRLVTGDTKVVEKGHGDGLFITTSGIGILPDGLVIGPSRARVGDVVIVSGTVGDHGMAIMSVREGLEFESLIVSDSAPLNGLVAEMLAASPSVHVLRDATRGGVAAVLNEIAQASHVGILIRERDIPVNPAVSSACELLGMDPLHVANEGKLLAFVAPEDADLVLARMRAHPLGVNAAAIGTVVEGHAGMVVAATGIGATRVVSVQIGEQLPRIC